MDFYNWCSYFNDFKSKRTNELKARYNLQKKYYLNTLRLFFYKFSKIKRFKNKIPLVKIVKRGNMSEDFEFDDQALLEGAGSEEIDFFDEDED